MNKEGMPVCSRKESGLDCPDNISWCPYIIHEWANSYFASLELEQELTRSTSLKAKEAAFIEQGCGLFTKIRVHREKQLVQK